MKADRKKIKQIMARAHMTVEDVARAAGLPPQTTAAIICGMNVNSDTLAKIAQALDVGMADIVQGAVPMRKSGGRAGEDQPQASEPPLPAGQVRIRAEKFAEAMGRSGLTVKQLAKRAGVSPAVIRSIKRGAEAHKAATVDKLADALGVAVCYITEDADT